MIVDRYDPMNIFEMVPKLELGFEPELRELDRLLEDDELFSVVKADLAKRYPNSERLGRPDHPRFPATQGLSGSAVASGETVVVGEVREDPRYLPAFRSTRSEIIVPVVDRAARKVVGTIDVESEKVDAFSEEDRAALERCAVALAELFG